MKGQQPLAKNALTEYLEGFGFFKKADAWVLKKRDFLVIIDMQKSQWSNTYYINTGIQLESLEDRLPKSRNGVIYFRILRDDREKSRDSFDLENDTPLIRKMIKEQVIEVFSGCETKDELKDIILNNLEKYRHSLTIQGKEALGIPREPTSQSSEKPSIIIQRYDSRH